MKFLHTMTDNMSS